MKIVHLSDLHFGTEELPVVEALVKAINASHPDLIVVSGDFTQVASNAEFAKARAFIEGFDAPVFCVPGNHDIPPFRLVARFLRPYKRYKRHINEDLCPVLETKDAVIAGVNSARRFVPHWNWANGAISGAQLEKLRAVYETAGNKRRICVFHHPIHQALNSPMDTVVFGARAALRAMNDLKVDLVLTGHVHHASITTLGDMDHVTIYLSASTALSSRLREQQNGFNIIEIDKGKMHIELWAYNGQGFEVLEEYAQKTAR